jgi:hypothetical protein
MPVFLIREQAMVSGVNYPGRVNDSIRHCIIDGLRTDVGIYRLTHFFTGIVANRSH